MKKLAAFATAGLVSLAFAAVGPAGPAAHATVTSCPLPVVTGSTATVTCTYTGDAQSWTVPAGVTSAIFDVFGAQGGSSQGSIAGGNGGEATATISVTPGETLQVNVGGQPATGDPASGGFNGGGPGGSAHTISAGVSVGGGGGGGASDVRRGGTDLAHRVVVAGGGGGGGGSAGSCTGGAGGGTNGDPGSSCNGEQGGGAMASTGGTAGTVTFGGAATNGTTGLGGTGGSLACAGPHASSGGGGGGGLAGGGGATGDCSVAAGGGGGGSGFTPSGTGMTNGVQTGNGKVVITYRTCTSTPGTTCLMGTTINGSLIVPAGTSLVLLGSTVNGSVTSNGASGVTICGSRITDSLSVQNSTGPVLIGDGGSDETPPCAGNAISGSALVKGNTANTEVGANHVSGSVEFENNTGPTGPEASPEVGGNTISSSLVCSGNATPVTNDGVPNQVTGARTGQCIGL